MKQDISYRALIIGAVIYIICSLLLKYCEGVFSVLEDLEAAEKSIDPLSTKAFDFRLSFALIYYFGISTFTFWAIFLVIERRTNFFNPRIFIIAFAAIFLNQYFGYNLYADDNFRPYIYELPDISRNDTPLFPAIFINYCAFLFVMGGAYIDKKAKEK